MTDSSTEAAENVVKTTDEAKKVPIQALAKERAEKRAAREEASKLGEELEQARKAAGIDEETFNKVVEEMAAEARRAVAAELKPVQDEVSKWKMAAKLGLTETQVDKVMEIRMQNPNLSEHQALTLAKAEHADLFPSQQARSWSPTHGGLPVSGNSDRPSDKPNFVEKMNEAVRNGDRAAAQQYATQEALARFRRVFDSRSIR